MTNFLPKNQGQSSRFRRY